VLRQAALTDREEAVLRLMARGRTQAVITAHQSGFVSPA
jgi:DNA-binding CsgD family transcriptional regulator